MIPEGGARSCTEVQCVLIKYEELHQVDFRRMQVHEQQAERQKRNLLQKTMVFACRADQIQTQDLYADPQFLTTWLNNVVSRIMNRAPLGSLLGILVWDDVRRHPTNRKVIIG